MLTVCNRITNSAHRTRNLLPGSRMFQRNSNFIGTWLQLPNLDGISAQDG